MSPGPAERRDDRRALQPPAARCRREHVAEAIGDVHVDGAATGLTRPDRRLRGVQAGKASEAGNVVVRRLVADAGAPLVVVLTREQRLERHLCGVAVQRIPVGERELPAFDDDVDELRGRELGEVVTAKQRELLEPDRAGCPRLRLADREAAVLERRDRLERRVPRGHVGAGQEPAFARDETVDLLGDEALVPREPCLLDLVLARAAAALLDDAAIRGARAPGCGRARPPPAPADRGRVTRASSRRAPRSARSSRERARGADSRAPRSRWRTRGRRRDATCRSPAGGAANLRTRRGRRRRGRPCPGSARGRARGSARSSRPPGATPCPHSASGSPRSAGPEHGRDLAARSVQMRLDDLQHEPRRDGRIEGVAPALEHRHPRLRREPVRRRDHPEGAAQLGTGRERHARSLRKPSPTGGTLA